MAEDQVLGPQSTVVLDTFTGNWIRSEAAWTLIGAYKWDLVSESGNLILQSQLWYILTMEYYLKNKMDKAQIHAKILDEP